MDNLSILGFEITDLVVTAPEKLLLIPTFIGLFIAVYLWKKSALLAIFVTTLALLPFNASFRLDFGVFHDLYDPYIYNVEVNYLVPTLYFSDFLLGMMALVLFGVRWASIRKLNFKKLLFLFAPSILAVLYLVFHLLTHFHIVTLLAVIRLALVIISLNLLLLQNPRELSKMVLDNKRVIYVIILISVILQLYIGFNQIVSGSNVGFEMLGESSLEAGRKGISFVNGFGDIFLRAYGTLPHPNVLSYYGITIGLITMLLGSSKAAKQANIINSLAFYLLLTLISILIVITFSRTAILIWAIALVVFAFKTKINSLIIKIFEFVQSKFQMKSLNSLTPVSIFGAIFGGRENSLTERVVQMQIAFAALTDTIFFAGVGAGRYSELVRSLSSADFYTYIKQIGSATFQPAHNVLIAFFIEHGLIGTVFLAVITLAMIYLIIKRFQFERNNLWLMVIILGALTIISTVDHYLYMLPVGNLFVVFTVFLVWLNLKPKPFAA